MKKDAIKLTFSHQVTRDELIESLDRTLRFYGCSTCGLNGWDGIFLQGDPEPFIRDLKDDLLSAKLNTLINVEHFQVQSRQLNQLANIAQR